MEPALEDQAHEPVEHAGHRDPVERVLAGLLHADDHVAVRDAPEEPPEVRGVVLPVAVAEQDQLLRRQREGVPERPCVAAPLVVVDQGQAELVAEPLEDRGRAVAAAVLGDDERRAGQPAHHLVVEAADDVLDHLGLVVHEHHDRDGAGQAGLGRPLALGIDQGIYRGHSGYPGGHAITVLPGRPICASDTPALSAG